MAEDQTPAPVADPRGESMVKLHFEKVEAEREAAAIGHLRSMLPKLAEKTLALALGDCKMDVERSLMLLRQFQAENFEHLANLHRKRAREGADEEQDDTHAASSGAESDRSEGSPRARKHKRSDKDKKDKKHKRKSKKEKKKSKRSKRQESPEREARSQFGAHGIIRESDYAIKKPEFLAWAAEHKEIDVESLTRGDERELFKDFMEDYNTCTMPHRKFYDLAAYQRKKAAERQPAAAADRGNISAKVAAAIEQDDERLRRAEMFAERKRQADVNAQDKYSRMLMSGESLKELQDREMTRLQAQAAYKTGDMETAKRLRHKLNPTDAAEERQQDGSGQQQY